MAPVLQGAQGSCLEASPRQERWVWPAERARFLSFRAAGWKPSAEA